MASLELRWSRSSRDRAGRWSTSSPMPGRPAGSPTGISSPGSAGNPHVHVLVTGGAGFVGANLVEYLQASGHDVRVLDDLSASSRPAWWGRRSGPQSILGSVEDPAAARRA